MTKYNQLNAALADWVDSNGLMLNVSKTNYMIFSNSNSAELDAITPKMRSQPIVRKAVAKFLGVLMDQNLTWSEHIKTLKAKLAKNCGILYRLKGILPTKAMLTLYHSFIQSHLMYCSVIWGLGSKNSLKSLFCGQKMAIRAVMTGYVNYYYDKETEQPPAHTKQAFKEHKILTIHSIILKNILLYLFKSHHMPSYLPSAIVTLLRETVATSRNEFLQVHQNSIFIKGKRLYNEITHCESDEESAVPTDSLSSFKTRATKNLLHLQSLGSAVEWTDENFRLCTQHPQRRSARLAQ